MREQTSGGDVHVADPCWTFVVRVVIALDAEAILAVEDCQCRLADLAAGVCECWLARCCADTVPNVSQMRVWVGNVVEVCLRTRADQDDVIRHKHLSVDLLLALII